MEAEKANYKIMFMARLLGVKRAGFYAWHKRAAPARQARRQQLAELIEVEFRTSNQTSGCRRIHAALIDGGERVCVGTVASIMRELGLVAVQPRSKKRTTIPAADAEARPDLLGRDFTADAPGCKLVGDITYLRTGEGWLYLATVIDLHNRMVVGWQMATHMRTELISDALQMAHSGGHIRPGAVFHSDRGSQYTSAEYAKVASDLGVTLSVGRTGSCHDNAVAESWFSMLKNEMYYRYRFATRKRARFAVMQYIEVFYNRKRRHSTLGYRSPAEALADHYRQLATAA